MLGQGLPRLSGYPFEVRYSEGAHARACAAADLASAAFAYFTSLFSGLEPSLALIVAEQEDWSGSVPYGLAYFNDDPGQLRPGILVMPAGGGEVWSAMARDIRDVTRDGYAQLVATYPDGNGGVDLAPFFDLITIHELAHAFETFGDLRLPTHWLSEIFVNLALHAFVAERLPTALSALETLPTVGARSRALAERFHRDGYTSLEQLEAHYPEGDDPMDALNYVWFQYRWMRLAAETYDAEGERGLVRFWECFHARTRADDDRCTAVSLAPLLTSEISATLGHAVRTWL